MDMETIGRLVKEIALIGIGVYAFGRFISYMDQVMLRRNLKRLLDEYGKRKRTEG